MRDRTRIRKYTRMEKPFSSRFRIKQYEDRETPLPDWDTVALKNLGAGGMLFNCNKNLEVDSVLDLEINVSETTSSINCVGKAIRIKESERDSMFDIAIEFTEIDKQEREMINSLIMNSTKRHIDFIYQIAILLLCYIEVREGGSK